jgi:hypothetical protein
MSKKRLRDFSARFAFPIANIALLAVASGCQNGGSVAPPVTGDSGAFARHDSAAGAPTFRWAPFPTAA